MGTGVSNLFMTDHDNHDNLHSLIRQNLLLLPVHSILYLFIIAIPIACISWTFTHEELFREPRVFFTRLSERGKSLFVRKLAYMLTCEYCFSHYVTIAFLIITGYQMLFDDWRGYLIAGFSLVWIANIYMSLYGFVRLGIKKEKIELDEKRTEVDTKLEEKEVKSS